MVDEYERQVAQVEDLADQQVKDARDAADDGLLPEELYLKIVMDVAAWVRSSKVLLDTIYDRTSE